MAVSLGKHSEEPCLVSWQFPDGRMFEMKAYMVSYSVGNSFGGSYPVEVSAEFKGISMAERISPSTFESRRKADAWQCPYCGTANPRDALFCGAGHTNTVGCAAAKPIQYY